MNEIADEKQGKETAYLGGFAHFLPDHFPFVGVVVFDGLHQGRALFGSSAVSLLIDHGCVRRTKLLTSSSANSA
jgi:hypothetical protein